MRRKAKPTLSDVMKVTTKTLHELAVARREIRILQRIVTQGAEAVLPWTRLSPQRRRQVEYVIDYLKIHSDRKLYTIPRAAREAFRPAQGGYPNAGALASYLYSVNADSYV